MFYGIFNVTTTVILTHVSIIKSCRFMVCQGVRVSLVSVLKSDKERYIVVIAHGHTMFFFVRKLFLYKT